MSISLLARSAFVARVFAVCLSVSIATLSGAASAAPTRDLEAKAVAEYEAGNFSEAVRLFEAAFEEGGDPNLLYNIGRVYEEAGKLEEAIEYYDRFVHAEGVGLDTRVVASERLSQLKKVVGQDEPAAQAPPAQAETDEPSRPTASSASSPVGDEAEPNAKPGRAMAISGYVLLAVGVPALVAGGVFGGLALQRNERLQNEQLDDPTRVQDQGRRQALTADVLVPLGATLALTGLTLVLVNASRARARTARLGPAIGPAIGSAGTGVVLSGRF